MVVVVLKAAFPILKLTNIFLFKMDEKYCLKIINAPEFDAKEPKEVLLEKKRYTIGRKGSSSDLLLDSIDIAKEQAVIFRGFSQWYIKLVTLDFQNNFRVNYDVLKTQPHQLKVGDVITLASFSFMFAKYVAEGASISLKSILPNLTPFSKDINLLSTSLNHSIKPNTNSLVGKLDYFLSEFSRVLAISKMNSDGKMRVSNALKHEFLENGKEFESLVRKLEDDNSSNQRYISVLESDNEDLHKFYKDAIEVQQDELKNIKAKLRFGHVEFDNYRAEISVELNKLKLELWEKEEQILDEKESNAKLSQEIFEIEKKLKDNQSSLCQDPELLENDFSNILKNYLEFKVSKLEQKCNAAAEEIKSALTSYRQERQKNTELMIKMKGMEEHKANLHQRVLELETLEQDTKRNVLKTELNLHQVEKSKLELEQMFRKNLINLTLVKKKMVSLKTETKQIEMDLKEKLSAQESEIKDKDKQIKAFQTKLNNVNSLRREKDELMKKDALKIATLEKNVLIWKELYTEKASKYSELIINLSKNEAILENQKQDFAKKLSEKEKLVKELQLEFETLQILRSKEKADVKLYRETSNTTTLEEALRSCNKKGRELSILREVYCNIEKNLLKILTEKEEVIRTFEEMTQEQKKLISCLERDNCFHKSVCKIRKHLHVESESKFKEAKTKLDSVSSFISEEFNCVICAGLLRAASTIRCGHTFCRECINAWKERKKECPICRTYISSEVKVPAIDKFIEKSSNEICLQ